MERKGSCVLRAGPRQTNRMRLPEAPALDTFSQPVKEDVNYRRRIEREQLAQQESADHGNSQRTAQLRAQAAADRQRNSREQRGHCGHHDGAETQQAGFVDRFSRILAMLALGLKREVYNQNAVFLHDADEQNNADDSHDAKILAEEHKREQRANARRRQRGQNGNGMNKTLVKDAKNDVNGNQSSKNQQRFVGERILERRSSALEACLQAGRKFKALSRFFNVADRRSQ